MSFFAVLKTESSVALGVVDCHLNLWSIGGLLGHRLFIFDVGLGLDGLDQQGTSMFELAIPFGTRADRLIDLGPKLKNEEILNLIFSGNAKLSISGTRSTIDYSGEQRRLCCVDTSRSLQITSKPDFSVWRIELTDAIMQGEKAYVRIRFEVDHTGRTWLWKRSAGAKNGALLDFRIGDVRSSPTANGHLLASRVLKIKNLFLFIIAPFWLKLHTASPTLHYIRVLEGKAWQPYLGMSTALLRDDKSVIYQWRRKDVATDKDAFHAFLDLVRDSPLATYFALLRGTLLLVGTGVALVYLIDNRSQIAQAASDHLGKIGIVGLSILAYTLFKDWEHIRDLRASLRHLFYRFEYFLLRIRGTIG